MKADPAAQALLIDLQALDLDIDRNRHRLVVLPERDRVTALGARLQELNDERVIADTELADLRRAVARADADVTSVRARTEQTPHRYRARTRDPRPSPARPRRRRT